MLHYDIGRAKQAVQFLVDSPYVKHHVKRLHNVVQRPRALPFTGDAEPLNELLVIGRQSTQALENLLAVVENKREQRPGYMAAFMAAKRARERKLVDIEELLLARKLTLDERMALIRATQARWANEKKAHIERCCTEYREQIGREPQWLQRNQFIKDFWMHKDMELDTMLDRTKDVVSTLHHGLLPGQLASTARK
jgi:hypothetical protein